MARKNYKNKALKEIKEFLLWFLCRFIFWIKSVIEWSEDIFRDLSKDLKVYILLAAIVGIGGLFYMYEQQITITDQKRSVLYVVTILLFIGSVSLIVLKEFSPFQNEFEIKSFANEFYEFVKRLFNKKE